MAYNKCGKSLFLRHAHERHGAFTHLTDAAGSRAYVLIEHSLNRVDDNNIGRERFNVFQNLCKSGLRKNIYVALIYAEALSAHFKLPLAFLAGDVKDLRVSFCLAAKLEQKR